MFTTVQLFLIDHLNFIGYNQNLSFYKISNILFFLAKFARNNLPAKFSAVSLLNSKVVIYLSWSRSVNVFSVSPMFVLSLVFLTKLLTLGTLFSTAVRVIIVARLLILGTLSVNSSFLELRSAVVAKLTISGILSSILLILYSSFLTTSFLTTLLIYLN